MTISQHTQTVLTAIRRVPDVTAQEVAQAHGMSVRFVATALNHLERQGLAVHTRHDPWTPWTWRALPTEETGR